MLLDDVFTSSNNIHVIIIHQDALIDLEKIINEEY